MICERCGRDFVRRHCEFCRRSDFWDVNLSRKFRRETFSLRITKDLEKFAKDDDVFQQLDLILSKGKGLFVHGAVGSGKTIFSAMLTEEFGKRCFVNNRKLPVIFKTVPQLLLEIRDSFGDNNGSTELELTNIYSSVPWLVLDDLGAEKMSEWVLQTLYIIINSRYENLLPTIFTSNFDLDNLAVKLGDDRIPSRIFGMCYTYRLASGDRRLS